MSHIPYLLPVEKVGNTESLVQLLRDFDEIQHIRYVLKNINTVIVFPSVTDIIYPLRKKLSLAIIRLQQLCNVSSFIIAIETIALY